MACKILVRGLTLFTLVMGCLLTAQRLPAQSQAGIRFTTIAPVGEYETLGIVQAVGNVSPAIMDPTKPFKEAFRSLTPELETQAKARAANMVVITNISLIPVGGGSLAMIVHGTAIRTGALGSQGAMTGNQPATQGEGVVPGATGAAAADASGSWYGELLEPGGKEPLKVTLNLAGAVAPGEVGGGYVLQKSGCEFSLKYEGKEGSLTFFKTANPSRLSCPLHVEVSIELLPNGLLEMKVYSSKRAAVKCQGQLSRG